VALLLRGRQVSRDSSGVPPTTSNGLESPEFRLVQRTTRRTVVASNDGPFIGPFSFSHRCVGLLFGPRTSGDERTHPACAVQRVA
jgi:hypothetical protein